MGARIFGRVEGEEKLRAINVRVVNLEETERLIVEEKSDKVIRESYLVRHRYSNKYYNK